MNILGRRVHLQRGDSVIADETYIYDSVIEPEKHIVAGYESIMPSFKGQLNEEDIMAIIEYIRIMPSDQTAERNRP